MKARHKDTGEIIELAEQGIVSHDGRRFCWNQVELIPEPIDEFKSSLPSNLDEAAEEFASNDWLYGGVWHEAQRQTFKAGAEWMARQGASFNTKVGWLDGPTILDWPDDILDKFEMGDEVTVQIRKRQ